MTVNLELAKSNTKTKTRATRSPIPTIFGLNQRCYHHVTCHYFSSTFDLYQHHYRRVTCFSTPAIFSQYQHCYRLNLWSTPTSLSSCNLHSNPCNFGLYQHCSPVSVTLSLHQLCYYHCITYHFFPATFGLHQYYYDRVDLWRTSKSLPMCDLPPYSFDLWPTPTSLS